MDEHVEPNSPDQSAPPPVSYSKDQKPTWNVFGKFFALFSNRTTAIVGVLVLVLGVVAGTVAVQRSTETRQHAAGTITTSPCPPLGDVNGDGKVDAVDALFILRHVAGLPVSHFIEKNADVDRVGGITSVDALKIQRYVAGLDSTFPGCRVTIPTPTRTPTIRPNVTPIPTNTPTTSSISGKVFMDNIIKNGTIDPGEVGYNSNGINIVYISRITKGSYIIIKKPTDQYGNFSFENLQAGTYMLSYYNVPFGYVQATVPSVIKIIAPPSKTQNLGLRKQ